MATAATDFDNGMVTKAYDRWAPIYDMVFGPVFDRGRKSSIAAAERIGGRILDVGIGTGISLPDYSPKNRIFGVDISAQMLAKAQERVTELGLDHVEGLEVMDAMDLQFPDAAFDVVLAQYVVTAVPDPDRALDEFVRVLKPGGELIITTRIGADSGLRRTLEHWFQPVARKLGFRTEFAWERYAAWASRRPDVRLIERRALPPLGHFSLLRFGKEPAA